MVRRLAFALVCLCAAVPAASAQTSTSNTSTSNSSSDANTTTNAGSVATSQAGTSSAVINQFQNTPSHTDATIRNVPNTGGIALFGGTNPCTVGAAGTVSAVGVGVGLGGQWSARGCERRNAAVILFQANMPDVAVAVLCQDEDIRNAFRASGRPCPQDVRTAAAAGTPPVAEAARPAVAMNSGPSAQPVAVAQTRLTPAPEQAVPLAIPAPAAASPTNTTMAPGSQYASVAVTTADGTSGQTGYRGPRPAWCNYPTDDSKASSAARAYYCH